AFARSAGMPGPQALGGTDTSVGAALYGRAAGKVRLARDWALRLDVLGGWAVARPVVQFLESDVASWGRPFVAVLGGGELQF
ncbi:MAG TPA: hypothetical protein VHO67_20515, partial [Polyangia bacterium]|nr:hypothetical protein [Polyangia bacterium]